MLDPEITASIDLLIEADASEEARTVNALPVYRAMGGTLLLRRDGEVLHWTESNEIAVEPDPKWRRLALIAAVERYPALASLRPARDAGSESCGPCKGRGRIEIGSHHVRCGTCLGLGWV